MNETSSVTEAPSPSKLPGPEKPYVVIVIPKDGEMELIDFAGDQAQAEAIADETLLNCEDDSEALVFEAIFSKKVVSKCERSWSRRG